MSLFEITLFILERDNDDKKKNNRLYLNGSKGTIDAPLLNICIFFLDSLIVPRGGGLFLLYSDRLHWRL